MTISTITRYVTIVASVCLASVWSLGAGTESKCVVTLSAPNAGAQVGKDGWVRGTAKLPEGSHLWILSHVKDLAAEWWPQGQRPAVIERDGTWVIKTAYGRAEDVGDLFEVAVVVVDENTNTRLLDWFKTAKQNDYPSITFPDVVPGCVPEKVIVKKVSH